MLKVTYIVNCREEERFWFDLAIDSILDQKGVQRHIVLSTVHGDPCIDWLKKFTNSNLTYKVVLLDTNIPKSPPASFAQIDNALPHIEGDYVTFCSANDPLLPNKSLNEITKIESTPGALVCYSSFHLAEADGNGYNHTDTKGFPSEYTPERHLQSNFIYDGSMIDVDLFKKYVPFNHKWYNCGYWDLWLRIFKGEGNVFCYNSKPTKFYIQHAESMHIKRQDNPEVKALRDKHSAELVAHHRKELGL